MNNLKLHIYDLMNKANVKNPFDSVYWLFSVENLIVKENGINHRYLKVYFFHRKFQKQENLMQMTLDFHGEIIQVQKFSVSKIYCDENIMGFVHEIDLADSSTDLKLIRYVQDGKEVIVGGKMVPKLIFTERLHELNIINDFITSKEDQKWTIYPTICDAYWICHCGYVNTMEMLHCDCCGCDLSSIRSSIAMSKEELYAIALKNIAQRIIISTEEKIEITLQHLSENCEKRYGVARMDVLNLFQMEELLCMQNQRIEEKIQSYLVKTPPMFDMKLDFHSNLKLYASQITNKVITTEKVLSFLDIDTLNQEYDRESQKLEKAQKQKRRKMIIGGSTASVALIGLIVISFMLGNANRSKLPQETLPVVKQSEKEKEETQEPSIDNVHVYAGIYSTIALDSDGNLQRTRINDTKYDHGQNNLDGWQNLVAISSEQYHTVGLRKDGTVVSTNIHDIANDAGQSNVYDWKNIRQVSAATYNTIGLRDDGTVLSTAITNNKYDYGQGDVEGWKDIIQIAASWDHTIGLKKDGTVVSTKIKDATYDYGETDVESWTDIVYIATASNHTVGIKKDGSVIATGYHGDGRCDVTQWEDVVKVSLGRFHSLGLRKDGTVLSTSIGDKKDDFGQNQTGEWKEIVEISAGWFHSVGLKKDGTIMATNITQQNEDVGQGNVADWQLIREKN